MGFELVSLLVLAVGAVMMFLPYPLWWLLWGWRKKQAFPSDDLLVLFRYGGIVVMLLGIMLWTVASGR